MSVNVYKVFLRDGTTGTLVPAELYDSILSRHLDQYEQSWKPVIESQGEDHRHWDWQTKMEGASKHLSYQPFAIECSGMTQGLMIVNTIKRCRLPSQANKHLVYVEYLEAAPWNRGVVQKDVFFKGVGSVMMAAAIQLSIEEGNQGRIGLHSLPLADTFYRDHCGMTDLGPDASYHPNPKCHLRYFEMTEAQSAKYLKGR